MSRTRGHGTGGGTNGQKSPGYEYWGRRPLSMCQPGKVTKRLTHSVERARERMELKRIAG